MYWLTKAYEFFIVTILDSNIKQLVVVSNNTLDGALQFYELDGTTNLFSQRPNQPPASLS